MSLPHISRVGFFRGCTEFHETIKRICVTPVLFQTAKQDPELLLAVELTETLVPFF